MVGGAGVALAASRGHVSSKRHCFEQDGKTYCEVQVVEPKAYPIIKRGEEPELLGWAVGVFLFILGFAVVAAVLGIAAGNKAMEKN